jgi:Zn-dependent protease
VLLSVAVGLLCFGLVALVPVPPMDGFRLLRLAWSSSDPVLPAAVDRLGVLVLLLLLVVPVGRQPLLLSALDLVGTPLLAVWS